MPITQHTDTLVPQEASQTDAPSAMPNVYTPSHTQIPYEQQQKQNFVGRLSSFSNQDHCETGDIDQNTIVAQNEHTPTSPRSTRHAWNTSGYDSSQSTNDYRNPIGTGHFDQVAVEVKMISDTSSRGFTGSPFENQYLQISPSGTKARRKRKCSSDFAIHLRDRWRADAGAVIPGKLYLQEQEGEAQVMRLKHIRSMKQKSPESLLIAKYVIKASH